VEEKEVCALDEIERYAFEVDGLEANLELVRENIARAARKVGREPSEITLVAVSKTKPVSVLEEAYDIGVRVFGENRVQELTEKIDRLPDDIEWHMIGHLQKNKVKYIVGRTALIHSVDSFELGEEISKQAVKKGVLADVLVEVNVGAEESKFGVSGADTERLVRELGSLPGIRIKGLMTVAPYVEDPEDNRKIFAELAQLAVDIDGKNIDNVCMNVLSMGMTGDYQEAVEEGATIVRVGTGIFGER
jgi:pyridoxal phosphate enzyme (YggS family)